MSFEFAHEMEDEVKRAARRFKNDIYGIKPWYSYAGLLERSTTRVFVGAQPGGGLESQELDRRHRHLERVYTEPGYNSWLDDVWGERGETLQEQGRAAFKAMYGNDAWEQVLRDTPCFNVAPFRAHRADDFPGPAWECAQGWFQRVLEHLRPRLIICNGNVEGRSAWAVVPVAQVERIPVRPRAKSYIKIGSITSGTLDGAAIVGLPSLSRFGGEDLFEKLRELRRSRPNLFV